MPTTTTERYDFVDLDPSDGLNHQPAFLGHYIAMALYNDVHQLSDKDTKPNCAGPAASFKTAHEEKSRMKRPDKA